MVSITPLSPPSPELTGIQKLAFNSLCKKFSSKEQLEYLVTHTSEISLLQIAAFSESTAAQYELAYRYEHGEGVEQDLEQASKWYQILAKTNHVLAICGLGRLYLKKIAPDSDLCFQKLSYVSAALYYSEAFTLDPHCKMATIGILWILTKAVNRLTPKAEHWPPLVEKYQLGQSIQKKDTPGSDLYAYFDEKPSNLKIEADAEAGYGSEILAAMLYARAITLSEPNSKECLAIKRSVTLLYQKVQSFHKNSMELEPDSSDS